MNKSDASKEGVSCLLSVYSGDNSEHFDLAIHSVVNQSRPPNEIVIVADGLLPVSLMLVVLKYINKFPIVFVELPVNVGRGLALASGFAFCNFDLVAIMDADDVARVDRLSIQESHMRMHPHTILLGGSIEEFSERPGDLKRVRSVPRTEVAIRKSARTRNPFNQVTVLFRKSALEAAGGYRHKIGFEDYDLWLRMLQLPGSVENLKDVLVDVRVGNGMLMRRRGWRYLQMEMCFLLSCRQEGLISIKDLLISALVRIPVRLIPSFALKIVYEKLLRQNY